MAHRMSRVAVLGIVFCVGSLHAQFLKIPGIGAKANTAAGLTDATIGSGLREALSVGTQKAVRLVAKPGGYFDNEAIKIPVPQNLRTVERVARGLGQGAK
ncbi:MAG TPA: DUF4197 family protein, partial [Edaphobacter sp.]|nr:DUF4197 family protein [Edaphobacter sp.]